MTAPIRITPDLDDLVYQIEAEEYDEFEVPIEGTKSVEEKIIPPINTDYIPRKQLAKELGKRLRGRPYSEFTLIAWEKDGKGPPVTRIGRDVVYRRESVEAWLRAQEDK